MRKLALALTLAAGCSSASSETVKQDAAVKLVTAQVLPAMKGDKLKATVLEVSYPPGGSSSAHRHPCPVIGYILEGRYRTQVEESRELLYAACERLKLPYWKSAGNFVLINVSGVGDPAELVEALASRK